MKRLSLATILCVAVLVSPLSAAEGTGEGYTAAGLYNLANNYAREGKCGLAVLNYERARLLQPDDPDINANLHFVRQAAHQPEPPVPGWQSFLQSVSPGLVGVIAFLALLLFGTVMITGRYWSRWRWLRPVLFAASAAGLLLCIASGFTLWPTLHSAVVISPATPVRVSPVPMGESLFELPEAEMVRVIAAHEGFLLIETAKHGRGWVASSNVAPLIPQKAATSEITRLQNP